MTNKVKILAFAGSTRKESWNKKLINVAAKAAENAGAEVTVVDLREFPMPLYDGDLEEENGLPEHALRLKKLMAEADGLMVASPEYNGSLTAVLKNTIDWLSRPGGVEGSVFDGKGAVLMAASPGGLGGLRGLNHLRQILTNLGVLVSPKQRAVGSAFKAFNAEGQLEETKTREGIESLAKDLVGLLEKLAPQTVEA